MKRYQTKLSAMLGMAALLVLTSPGTVAEMPAASSADFCVRAQQLLATTDLKSNNTVYDDLQAFRKSKPGAEPLQTYQMLSWHDGLAVTVSCKVKTADHIRAVYGASAAGPQQHCPYITRQIVAGALSDLREAGESEAAERLDSFVLDRNAPYMTGSSYLSSYAPLYTGEDGRLHISSPGLLVYWESAWRYVMPDSLVGQTYCHLVTADYLKSVARGERQPGTSVSFDLPDS